MNLEPICGRLTRKTRGRKSRATVTLRATSVECQSFESHKNEDGRVDFAFSFVLEDPLPFADAVGYYRLLSVVGKVTVIKLLRYVTSYFFK